MAKENLQGSATIAALFDMDVRRVQQLTQQGIIEGKKIGGTYKFDLVPTVRSYINYLKEKANGRETTDKKSEKEKLAAEVDLKRAKADMADLQLKELQGKMHRSEDVEEMTTDLVYAIRSIIISLPGRLAVDVAAVKTPAEASAIIRRECNNVLEELSNYRYDPKEYAKRVREREGWQELSEGDE